MNRSDRTQNTRDTTTRKKVWQPAALLPEPHAVEGWTHRWMRKSLLGTGDPTNVSKSLREGWEMCKLSEYPELRLSVDADAANADIVEVGGLLLVRTPAELHSQSTTFYARKSENEVAALEAQLMSENDSRMPLFSERKTNVSFGKG